ARRRTNRGSGAFGRDQRAHPRPRPGQARARRPARPPAGLRRAFHRSELTARMRVISGTARGRQLRAAAETRPTADLIKGSIFSMLEALAYKRGFEPDEDGNLAAALAWPRVLDLFSGSGSLGIEALSRGARSAEFIEQDRDAARIIASNLRATDLDEHAQIRQSPVALALRKVTEPVDLVFADPPYEASA